MPPLQYADRESGPRPPLQWGLADVSWNGANAYTLTLSRHHLHEAPARWLDRNLGRRVREIVSTGFVIARVTGATWGDTGVSEAGSLSLTAPAEAWHESAAIRAAVEQAIDEAYEASREAYQTTRAILRGIDAAD